MIEMDKNWHLTYILIHILLEFGCIKLVFECPPLRNAKGVSMYLIFQSTVELDDKELFGHPKSKCISRKSGLMPCLNTILNCFALE